MPKKKKQQNGCTNFHTETVAAHVLKSFMVEDMKTAMLFGFVSFFALRILCVATAN